MLHRIHHKSLISLLPLVGLVFVAVACSQPGDGPWRSTGSYPIDIFQEMHYNQSYKAQEPPRLAPPVGSVPITGAELPLPDFRAEAAALTSPLTAIDADASLLEHAGVLYHINCSACHGNLSGGDGPVGLLFNDYGAPQPPAFTSDRITALNEGEVFWSVTTGFGLMPPFKNLLKPEERWLLAHLVTMPSEQREELLGRTKAPGYK